MRWTALTVNGHHPHALHHCHHVCLELAFPTDQEDRLCKTVCSLLLFARSGGAAGAAALTGDLGDCWGDNCCCGCCRLPVSLANSALYSSLQPQCKPLERPVSTDSMRGSSQQGALLLCWLGKGLPCCSADTEAVHLLHARAPMSPSLHAQRALQHPEPCSMHILGTAPCLHMHSTTDLASAHLAAQWLR